MTGQINDTCLFEGKEYSIVGIEGSGLYDPNEQGMPTEMLHTACYRGYYGRYMVEEGRLYLEELTLRVRDERYLPIEGILPKPDEYGTQVYHALRHPVAFSGQMLLGGDFIQERYVHMGFQSASSYASVIELELAEGAVTAVRDRSAQMAAAREAEARGEGDEPDIIEMLFGSFMRKIPPEPPQE